MSDTLSARGLAAVHSAVTARIDRGEIPGAVWLVARAGEVHAEALGVTAFGGTEPMTRDTIFRFASLTKPVVAAAAMTLVDDATLHLDDPVDRWLPELASRRVLARVDGPLDDTTPAPRPITVEDLLTFRMGFGMLTEPTFDPPVPIVQAGRDLELVLSEPDPRTRHEPNEWMRRFGSLPLMYSPGQRWQYNVGFLVLGVLLARAAGQPLGDLLQERILAPLGMHHTGFWLPAELTRTLPDYFMSDVGTGQMQLQHVSTPDEWSRPPAFPSAAAGLLSTADDFLAFAQMLLDDGRAPDGRQLISEHSVAQMTRNQLTADQIATGGPVLGGRGWGFGVSVVTEPDSAWPVPGRYGWSGGYGTYWLNDPQRNVAALLLTQVSDVLWNGTLQEFEALVAQV